MFRSPAFSFINIKIGLGACECSDCSILNTNLASFRFNPNETLKLTRADVLKSVPVCQMPWLKSAVMLHSSDICGDTVVSLKKGLRSYGRLHYCAYKSH